MVLCRKCDSKTEYELIEKKPGFVCLKITCISCGKTETVNINKPKNFYWE